MTKAHLCKSLIATLLLAGPVNAADFSDPTWPCIQRKVETLSLGVMWPHQVTETLLPADMRQDASALIDTLVLRRVGLEQAEGLIAEFAAGHPDLSLQNLGVVFDGVFTRLNGDRSQIIEGISRYSLKQIALAEAIDGTRAQMSDLMEAAEPDFDQVDRLEEQLDWDERIFRDRAQSLTYVCETPVILEKRAYAIAQMLLVHAPQ